MRLVVPWIFSPVWFPMAWLAASVTSAGCGGVNADSGSDAMMSVAGAQFTRGGLPADEGGPDVLGAFLDQTTFTVGFRDKALDGVLGEGATAALVALDGDTGYWVVPAGAGHADNPDAPSFSAPLSFSERLAAGSYHVLIQAVNASGRGGSSQALGFRLVERRLPEGVLVFSLFWEGEADLDLRVQIPSGIEIDKDNINSWSGSPGTPTDPEDWEDGGILDRDSNSQCGYDGVGNENVHFASEPPPGHYAAYVDTFSLCGESVVHWTLEVRWCDERVGIARGVSDPSCTLPAAQDVGVLALGLDVN